MSLELRQLSEVVRQKVDLVSLVQSYTRLEQIGRSFKGFSLFTEEPTPSFYVHPDRSFFKCFSTGIGGDCFEFIMRMNNLSFEEAVHFLAINHNIPITDNNGLDTAAQGDKAAADPVEDSPSA